MCPPNLRVKCTTIITIIRRHAYRSIFLVVKENKRLSSQALPQYSFWLSSLLAPDTCGRTGRFGVKQARKCGRVDAVR